MPTRFDNYSDDEKPRKVVIPAQPGQMAWILWGEENVTGMVAGAWHVPIIAWRINRDGEYLPNPEPIVPVNYDDGFLLVDMGAFVYQVDSDDKFDTLQEAAEYLARRLRMRRETGASP